MTAGARSSAADRLTVGQLATRTGFTPKTLRYYESIGLMPAAHRRASGYREYGAKDEQRLAFIARAKRMGLSLDEVRQILDLAVGGARPCGHLLTTLARHLDELDDSIAQLVSFRSELRRVHRDASRRPAPRGAVCGIIEHADLEVAPAVARGGGRCRNR